MYIHPRTVLYMETTTAAIAALVTRARGYTYTPSAAGEPIRSARKVINGHMVEAKVIGWDEVVVIELNKSTEALTIAQAAARVAA